MSVFGSRTLAAMIKAIRKEKQRHGMELSVNDKNKIVQHFRAACDDLYIIIIIMFCYKIE